jgi:hypothetical protein
LMILFSRMKGHSSSSDDDDGRGGFGLPVDMLFLWDHSISLLSDRQLDFLHSSSSVLSECLSLFKHHQWVLSHHQHQRINTKKDDDVESTPSFFSSRLPFAIYCQVSSQVKSWIIIRESQENAHF